MTYLDDYRRQLEQQANIQKQLGKIRTIAAVYADVPTLSTTLITAADELEDAFNQAMSKLEAYKKEAV